MKPLITILAVVLTCATSVGHTQRLLLKNAKVVDPAARKIRDAAIIIQDGKISEVVDLRANSLESGSAYARATKQTCSSLMDPRLQTYAIRRTLRWLSTTEKSSQGIN